MPEPDQPTERVLVVLGRGAVDADDPIALADDLGLTRGDGCFEATRIAPGPNGPRPDHLDAHLARLARSAAALDLPPLDELAWRAVIDEALARWEVPGEAYLKLVLTRGPERAAPAQPLGYALVQRIDDGTLARRAGVTAITLDRGYAALSFRDKPWLLGGVKTLSYAVNRAAHREAARRGVAEVVFVSTDGFVLEAPRSAVIQLRAGTLVTTPLTDTGVLASTVQAAIYAAAQAQGVPCEYRLSPVGELFDADGVWLVSSVVGPAPILSLDGRDLAQSPQWTRRLREFAGFPAT